MMIFYITKDSQMKLNLDGRNFNQEYLYAKENYAIYNYLLKYYHVDGNRLVKNKHCPNATIWKITENSCEKTDFNEEEYVRRLNNYTDKIGYFVGSCMGQRLILEGRLLDCVGVLRAPYRIDKKALRLELKGLGLKKTDYIECLENLAFFDNEKFFNAIMIREWKAICRFSE